MTMSTVTDREILINASINIKKAIINITQMECKCSKYKTLECPRCIIISDLRNLKLNIDSERLKLD